MPLALPPLKKRPDHEALRSASEKQQTGKTVNRMKWHRLLLRSVHEHHASADDGHLHMHRTPQGTLVRCYHSCKSSLLSFSFWLGVTVSFPLEHFIWEKLPPFKWLTHWLGL